VSDKNPDVVPQESVVDSPSAYSENLKQSQAIKKIDDDAVLDDSDDDEGPVSLDGPEADSEEADEVDKTKEANDEEAEEEAEEELIEFDFGGNKLEVKKGDVPPELAEKLGEFSKDIWADYTKKSQANADTAKILKVREEALQKVESLNQEMLDVFSKGKHLKSEIEQLSKVNMQALWQSNPDRARQLSDALSAKQAELQSIIQAVDQYETQIKQTRQALLRGSKYWIASIRVSLARSPRSLRNMQSNKAYRKMKQPPGR
jgi:hypothetical protein